MLVNALSEGELWPEGTYGEVVGPSGRCCFTVARACQILDRSDRTLRSYAGDGQLEQDPPQVGRAVFYLAESVERLARSGQRWPPPHVEPPRHGGEAAWHELAVSQGHDLEIARTELGQSQARVAKLEDDLGIARARIATLEADKRDLAVAIEHLGSVLAREPIEEVAPVGDARRGESGG